MKLIIEITGYLFILLGLIHVIFPKYFSWKEELARLSLMNRQMMEVHTFFISLGVALMGLLCVTSADLLLNTVLGKRVLLGFAIFWGARLYTQLFWYSPKLWKGKVFESIVHVCFTIFWIAVTAVFLLCSKAIAF